MRYTGTARDFAAILHAAFFGTLLSPRARALALGDQIGALERPKARGEGFSALGAVIRNADLSGWPVAGLIHWGGFWGHNWAVDPARQRVMVCFSNTTFEGCNGQFRTEVVDAVSR